MTRASFNPRAREGRDYLRAAKDMMTFIVSIHAPVKGATIMSLISVFVTLSVSIHAPVKGATLTERKWFTDDMSFNPRAREGRD